jgi:ribonuclease P protein subunit RPR2
MERRRTLKSERKRGDGGRTGGRRRRRRISRREARRIARGQVIRSLDEALDLAKKDMKKAERIARKARRLSLKFNVRLPYDYRILFCHGCKEFIVPGITSRVRLHPRQKVTHVCLKCGHVYRKIYSVESTSSALFGQNRRLHG